MVSEVSILIPVFNYSITALVPVLHAQCQELEIQFEIICLDDASEEKVKIENRALATLDNVIYEELPENINRSAIRNKLAQLAQFSYLLFLDNDSEIISSNYILQYLQAAQPNTIFIGGTLYSDNQPATLYLLHWKFGRNREQKPAAKRNQHPYQSLHVNNALVPRLILLQYPFAEKISQYGHEDSQWGKRLEQAKVRVIHLQNPVVHAGLEPTTLFLKKSQQAIVNLHQLYFTDEVGTNTSLINWYSRLSRFKMKRLFYLFYKIIKPFLIQNLHSSSPKLLYFDLYKLGLFVQTDYREKIS